MIAIIEKVYQFLWGDWIVLPLPGGSSFRLSLLVLILIPAGIWFTIQDEISSHPSVSGHAAYIV